MIAFGRHLAVAMIAVLACMSAWPGARAATVLGELQCSVAGGFGVAVSAFRNVKCIYTRANGVIETYAGYTGFVDVGTGINPPQIATYDVVSLTDRDLTGLQGDYDTRLVGGTADAGPATVLVGPAGITLNPRTVAPALASSLLNKLSFLEQLHLVYAGVTYPPRRAAKGGR